MGNKIKYTCSKCGGKFNSRMWKIHIKSKKHISNYNEFTKVLYVDKDFFDFDCMEYIGGFRSLIPRMPFVKSNWNIKIIKNESRN